MIHLIVLLAFIAVYFLIRPKFVTVTIRARVPSYIQTDVYLCGNLEVLGRWERHIKLDEHSGDLRCVELRVPRNVALDFKFTLGSWETVEKGPFFNEVVNRSVRAKHNLSYEFKVHNFSGYEEETGESTLTGDFEYIRNFQSRILHNQRNIIIYLPPSYKKNQDKRYPVLYMHDGNNIFDARTAFGGVEWQVDEAAQRLIEEDLMHEVIIVGIYNTVGRNEEYTPVFCPKHGGGKGRDYLNFIIKELMPVINNRFRTKTGAEHTGLMGSSLGGLISLYAGFEYSDYFGMLGVVSPSLWWADNYMEKEYIPKQDKKNVKIWMDMGTLEGVTPKGTSVCIQNTRAMKRLLEKMGYRHGQDLFYFEHENGSHDEASWAQRIHLPLLYFYGKSNTALELVS